MADIKLAYLAIVPSSEGLYSNDAADRGGETVLGIARNMDKGWSGWALVDSMKTKSGFPNNLKSVLPELTANVIAFYKLKYWDKLNLDGVNSQPLATELFDIGINMGTGVAALFLQRSLNVLNRQGRSYPDLDLDGQLGPKTIQIINTKADINKVLLCVNSLQGAKYIGICEANPSQEIFMNGWIERVK